MTNNVIVQTLERHYDKLNESYVEYVKIYTPEYYPLSWDAIYEAYSEVYPDCWAIQFFPPMDSVINQANVYHLWVYEEFYKPPRFMDISNKFN